MTKNLTEGKPLHLILGFAIPVLLSLLFQQFYSLVDTMIVGKTLGSDALAAVGSTGSLNFMVIGFCSGVCAGFAIPMAQSFGAKDEDLLKRYIGSSTWLCIIFSVVMAVGTALPCRFILQIMDTPPEILDDAYKYIVIIFWGIPVTYLYNILSSMIRSVGDSKTPVIFLALASLLNIALDFIFILNFNMGIAGAAWATVVSQGVSGVLCLIYLKKKFPILQPKGNQWKFGLRQGYKLCSIGIPMGLQYSVTAIGSLVLQVFINGLGTAAIAAFTAGSKLSIIFCCPFDSLGSTIATYAGQNVGAGKYSRIREGVHCCMLLGSIYAVIALVAFWLAGDSLSLLFLDGSDTLLLENARLYLVLNGIFYIPLAAVNVYRFCIQGMGFSTMAICAGALEMVGRAAVGMFAIPVFGYPAACLAGPVAWILADLFLVPACYYYIKRVAREHQAALEQHQLT